MPATAEPDLVAVLLDEHRELERTMEPLQGGVRDQEHLIAELIAGTSRYARTLREHLDLLVRRFLPDGPARADRALGEYLEVERVVTELHRHPCTDALFDELLGRLISALRNHLAEQEHELLPRLRRHVPADILRRHGLRAARNNDPGSIPAP